MKEDPVSMAMLYDFYGDVLTDKQREFFEYYHHDDLSLSEISENVGITRQGVRDVINRSEGVLRKMEERLGLVARYQSIQDGLNAIIRDAQEIHRCNEGRTYSADIRSAAGRILETAQALRDKD